MFGLARDLSVSSVPASAISDSKPNPARSSCYNKISRASPISKKGKGKEVKTGKVLSIIATVSHVEGITFGLIANPIIDP